MLLSLTKKQIEKNWSQEAEILSVHAGMDSMTWKLGLVNSLDNPAFQNAILKLANDAIIPNPFFELPFLKAAIQNLGGEKVQYLCLTKVIGNEERLKLFAPVSLSPIGIFRRKVLRTWNHPYAPLGIPLFSDNINGETLKAFIECINNAYHSQAKAIVFEEIAKEKSFLNNLYCSRHLSDRLLLAVGTPRAGLKPLKNFNYVETHFSGAHKQRLRRARTELEKLGKVSFSKFSDPKSIDKPLEDFLRLEQNSWKGAKNTALNDKPETAAFCRQAVINMAQQNKCHLHIMELDNKPVSALVTFEIQGFFYPWKIAFDEDYSRFSVGNLLAIHATSEFADNENFKGLDSLASEYNQTAIRLWPDEKELFTMTIGIGKDATRTALCISNELNRIKRIKTTLRKLLKK